MEIFGVGASELIFILIIAIIVLGPKDMQKAGRMIGRWLNQLIRSDSWKVFQRTSAELRNLPRNLMREANMEVAEMEKDLRNAIDPRVDATTRSAPGQKAPAKTRTTPAPSRPVKDSPSDQLPTPDTDASATENIPDDDAGSK